MAIYNSFPSFCTIYSCNINGVPYYQNFPEFACFAASLIKLKSLRNNVKYEIVLIKDDSYAVKNKLNYCWMTKHQLETYLRRIKTIKPFKYKVTEKEFEKSPCYKIDLQIYGTKKEITFVLQCIKRAYEWPYSFYLQQAYELQKLPEYRFESILNLFNVVWSTYRSDSWSGHSFSGNTMFEKYSDIREKLPHVQNVTDLYPKVCKDTVRAEKFNDIKYSWNNTPCDTTQWNNKFFKRILPYYIKNYNVLKK